ncbi:MAG: STAS domain-containing protein [Spirochaetaceae bacterium]|jgi:anti-anti-sigma factor|nr:STAS domain-containing protein [Spirochaetaceae bacterium]
MEIQFLEDRNNSFFTAKIFGDCDLYNAQHLFTDITEKINHGYKTVYVDFSGVRYLDSSGIWAVIRIIQHSKEKTVDLKFRGITGAVRKVMRLSNILSIIKEDDT